MEPRIRTLVQVEGVVQGVGFRPFVYSLATRLGLAGHVGNDSAGVFIEIEGPPRQVLDFLASLEHDAPPLARIEAVRTTALSPSGGAGFAIASSDPRRPTPGAGIGRQRDLRRLPGRAGRPG